ncbi:MAG TPA: DNA repair protein RecO [Acidobacteriaceae bacterium]|nr:DNA repair protein RecO [Acidobacteriaceae bacterium]
MMSHQAEAVVLRSWPVHEADQIVSLFTRDMGKIKGVAKSAAKSRRRFGGALEPMTHVRARYFEKPKQELVRLDSFEILHSPLSEPVDYARATALAFFVEVLEEILPAHDPQDHVFRLLLSVLEQTRVGCIWMPITYFSLWITRLMGWMPDLSRCLLCGDSLAGSPAYFYAGSDGVFCAGHSQSREAGLLGQARTLTRESHALAGRIFCTPVSVFAREAWPRSRGADLRSFAIQNLERHLERRLTTARALARLTAG